jgi:hypothetical protein
MEDTLECPVDVILDGEDGFLLAHEIDEGELFAKVGL